MGTPPKSDQQAGLLPSCVKGSAHTSPRRGSYGATEVPDLAAPRPSQPADSLRPDWGRLWVCRCGRDNTAADVLGDVRQTPSQAVVLPEAEGAVLGFVLKGSQKEAKTVFHVLRGPRSGVPTLSRHVPHCQLRRASENRGRSCSDRRHNLAPQSSDFIFLLLLPSEPDGRLIRPHAAWLRPLSSARRPVLRTD